MLRVMEATATQDHEAARAARIAAMKARRSQAQFGPEETIPANEVRDGDFLIRTPLIKWAGPRGGRYYQPAYRVERLVATAPSSVVYGGETEVRFTCAGQISVSVPPRMTVVVRRRVVA